MINFHILRYKNFLSTGDNFTTFEFEKTHTTLIVGTNGAGKSTMLDALSFALFGKAHRNVTKPQLINTINNKASVVEVEFTVAGSRYKIIRGQKPNIFEIYRDGKMLNQDAHAKEYQKILEQNILKLNHKTFHQIVVLGSSSFVPFMQLPSAHRREVIEDLLDINVFSKMNVLLKNKISQLKEKVADNNYRLTYNKKQIENTEEHIEDLQKISDAAKNELKDKIDAQKALIKELEGKEKDYDGKYLLHLISKTSDMDGKIGEMNRFIEKFKLKQTNLKNDIIFYRDNDNCASCKQPIDPEFKKQMIEESTAKAQKLIEASKTAQEKITELKIKRDEMQALVDNEEEKRRYNDTLDREISWNSHTLKGLEDGLKELNKGGDTLLKSQQKLVQYTSEQAQFTEEKHKLAEQREYNAVMTELLKDTGFKTKIIKQYLPVINQLTNKYLQVLDFYVHFDLDDTFKETIRSRHRDAFSYESFSEGEKQRIDLSLLFTWRQIAKMKNSISTNLLILDETFDSSLDASGIDNLLKILDTLDQSTNVFIISHKGDILDGKFERKIEFVKNKNFSKIQEEA